MILIKVYAHWCGHCIHMKPEWDLLKEKLPRHVKVVEIEDSELYKLKEFNKKNRVKVAANGYPTIAKVEKNKVYYYNGPRDHRNMLSWALQKMTPRKKTQKKQQRKNKTHKRKN